MTMMSKIGASSLSISNGVATDAKKASPAPMRLSENCRRYRLLFSRYMRHEGNAKYLTMHNRNPRAGLGIS